MVNPALVHGLGIVLDHFYAPRSSSFGCEGGPKVDFVKRTNTNEDNLLMHSNILQKNATNINIYFLRP